MKIAVQLNSDRNIIDTYLAPEDGAKLQVQKYSNQGWVLVESDPSFLVTEMYKWTVRQSDNKLVHVSTGMTPDEETTQANALLGKNVGQAIVTANSADKKADSAIASAAQLGKLIAPLLVAAQTNSNTTTGGTN